VSAAGIARKGRRVLGIAALAAALAVSNWVAAAPTDVFDECAADKIAHVGIKELAAACPRVEETIKSLGLDHLLYDGWRERLNSYGLSDLSQLVQRYSDSPRRSAPDIESLQPILQSMQLRMQDESWWDGAKRKIRNWLKTSNSALAKWLNDWFEHIDVSEHALDTAIYAVMVLLVLAAAIVLAREIRISGLRRRSKEVTLASTRIGSPTEAPSFEGPHLGGVRGLLQSLIDRLQSTGRLATARSLTHRELVLRSAFDTDNQRDVFARIAAKAESLLYGPTVIAQDDAQAISDQGRALLAQLSDRKEAR
jgi:hypothetical protein